MLWGFAENGIGMLVGNLATLRPLFRRMFNLGGSDIRSTSTHSATKVPQSFLSSTCRKYKPFDANYKLGAVKRDTVYKELIPTSTQMQGGIDGRPRSSIASDSESQKQIIQNSREPNVVVVSQIISTSSLLE